MHLYQVKLYPHMESVPGSHDLGKTPALRAPALMDSTWATICTQSLMYGKPAQICWHGLRHSPSEAQRTGVQHVATKRRKHSKAGFECGGEDFGLP
tara:strand:+ start:52 stop:339 length:288 start_codon:yes stop_codon:yes gene_type:complete